MYSVLHLSYFDEYFNGYIIPILISSFSVEVIASDSTPEVEVPNSSPAFMVIGVVITWIEKINKRTLQQYDYKLMKTE